MVNTKAGSRAGAPALRVATARNSSAVALATWYVKSRAVRFTSSWALIEGRSIASANVPCSTR